VSTLAGNAYLWVKAFHVVAVIAWMAGIFYLPRLFVYHADAAKGSDKSETFKVMERRLYNAIMTPAVKLLFVLALTAFHVWLGRRLAEFAEDRNTRPARLYRMVNELPTLIVIVIVVMVIVRPF
jgi:putative membrane protein